MAKFSLTKGSLQKEKQKLQMYKKILPSLELKRTQLKTEHLRAKIEIENLKKETEKSISEVADKLPMLANQDIELSGLVKIHEINVIEKSIVGVRVPSLESVKFDVVEHSFLAKPHWVDAYISHLQKTVELKLKTKVLAERLKRLDHALRRMTQHINLFEKILIPAAKRNIQKIQILLGEAERSLVVRSKMTKALHMRESSGFV